MSSVHISGDLEIEGFRSFMGRSSVPLPATGLISVEGSNQDTGGSSGSGKSTVLHAINYAFGICPIPSTELQSWLTESPPVVTLPLLIDGKVVKVKRGKKFELTVDGVPTEGSIKQKEEKLYQLIGLSPEILAAMSTRNQGDSGFFLSMTNSEKQDFLTPILGLDKFESAVDQATKKMSELEMRRVSLFSLIQSLESSRDDFKEAQHLHEHEQKAAGLQESIGVQLKNIQQLKSDYSKAKKDVDERVAAAGAAFSEQLVAAKEGLRRLQTEVVVVPESTEVKRLTELVGQCKTRLERLVQEDSKRETDRAGVGTGYVRKIAALESQELQLPGLLREISKIDGEVKKLSENVCPTCEREWLDNQQEREKAWARKLQFEGQVIKVHAALDQAEALKAEQLALPKFEPNPAVEKMRDTLSTLQSQLATEKQRQDGAALVQRAVRDSNIAKARTTVAEIFHQASEAQEYSRKGSEADLQELADLIDVFTVSFNDNNALIGSLQVHIGKARAESEMLAKTNKQLEENGAKLADLDTQIKAEKDFIGAIGREGFLGSIFDEILSEISDETNTILGAVANTRNCVLQFKSESVTQKGTVKREIKPFVTVNGFEASVANGLSGGMKSAVNLAVDLAVGAVIGRRRGCCPGWLLLDEAFDGLDVVSKETCLEILQRYAQDRLVLVVDHMSETKGLFSKKIVVQYKGGESRVADSV